MADEWSVVKTEPVAAPTPPSNDPWSVVGAKPATPGGDGLPWDVPLTGDQMRVGQAMEKKADESLPLASIEPKDPGFKHLLWSLGAGPLQTAWKMGQTATGERPLPTASDAAGEAMMGIVAPPVARGTARALGRVEPKYPTPMTPEQITDTGRSLRAPKVAKAERIVEKRANQAGPMTAQEAIDTLNKAREMGKPMMLTDVFQGGVQRLAGRMARAPGESSEIMTGALRGRNAGSVERLTGDVNAAFGAEGAYDANQALMAARKTAAKPEYDKAYDHPPINPDHMAPDGAIGAYLNRPSVKAGMANARKIAAEEGVDLTTLGIDLTAEGEPVLVRVPTWKTLDYIKRGIDNVVEQYRDPTTGKLVLDTYGRVADITRHDFVHTLRDLNPEYAKALDAWGGPSRSMDALQVGIDALKRSPEQNAARLAEMSENDREFARLGIGQTLRDIANKRGPLAGEFDRVAGTQYGSTSTREQLRPFFRNEKDYQTFVDSVTMENTMPRTTNKILGGSQTAERLMEDESPISGRDLAHGATAAATGHKSTMANWVIDNAAKLWDRRDPELNAQIARILGSTDITIGRAPTGKLTIQRPGPTP